MPAIKVYADLTFLLNFAMDYLLLWTTAKLCRVPIMHRRLFLAAFIGGIYGVGNLLIASTILYSLPLKLIISGLLLWVGLRPPDWRRLQKSWIIFFSLSFITAGACMAAAFLWPSAEQVTWSHYYLFFGVAALILIAFYAERYFAQTVLPTLLKYRVRLRFADKTCQGEGFLDTGNGLRDPLTHRPIVVAEYTILQACLPPELNQAMDAALNEEQRLEAFSRSSWGNRLRLIPFSSLGKKNGMLIGLRCDEVGILIGRREMLHKNLVVAIYPHKLSNADEYQLLIPAEVVQ